MDRKREVLLTWLLYQFAVYLVCICTDLSPQVGVVSHSYPSAHRGLEPAHCNKFNILYRSILDNMPMCKKEVTNLLPFCTQPKRKFLSYLLLLIENFCFAMRNKTFVTKTELSYILLTPESYLLIWSTSSSWRHRGTRRHGRCVMRWTSGADDPLLPLLRKKY